MKAIKAVIFDMDGVIVDSMPYHFLAWYEVLRPYGCRVTCFDVYAKEGERWDRSLRDFLRKAKVDPTPKLLAKIFRQRQKLFDKYFKRYLFKGVDEFLHCLKSRGYKLALVTGTPRHEVERILPRRIIVLFDCIVAGDSVKRGKPHPEPYIKARQSLQLNSRECVVVENAPFGIESAKKAGLFCIAVTTSLPKEYLKKADRIVDSLEQIPKLIQKSCLYSK